MTSKTPTPAETPRCVLVSKRGGQGAEFHICHGNHAQPALHYEYEDDATHTGAYLIDGDSHTPINIAKAANDKEVELPPPTRSPESSAPSTSEQQAEKTAAAHSDSDDDGDTGKREGLVPKRSEAGVLHEEPVQETMRQLQAQITELTSLLNALRADDVEEVKKSTPQVCVWCAYGSAPSIIDSQELPSIPPEAVSPSKYSHDTYVPQGPVDAAEAARGEAPLEPSPPPLPSGKATSAAASAAPSEYGRSSKPSCERPWLMQADAAEAADAADSDRRQSEFPFLFRREST